VRTNEKTSEAQKDRRTRVPQVRRRHQGRRLALVSPSKAGPIDPLVELGEIEFHGVCSLLNIEPFDHNARAFASRIRVLHFGADGAALPRHQGKQWKY
jgi:hypothetical protein